VAVTAAVSVPVPVADKIGSAFERWLVLLLGFALTAWRIATPRPAIARFFTEAQPPSQDPTSTGR
jgi:hypothetical protein